MLARARHPVELAGGLVVAHPVAPVVGEPQLLRARVPVEADRVAHASRDDLEAAPVGVHPADVRVALGIGRADVARRTDRHVELPVRAERDELASVVTVGREAVADDDGRRRVVETLLDAVVAQDPAHRRDVERAVAKRDARRLAQAPRDDPHHRRAARREAHRVHEPVHAADEQRALGAPGHRTGVRHARGDLDREPGRQPDPVDRQRRLRDRGQRRERKRPRDRPPFDPHCATHGYSCA